MKHLVVDGLFWTLQGPTMAIMGRFMLGKTVYCETIEADMKGVPPDDPKFDENCKTLLDVIVEKDDKV